MSYYINTFFKNTTIIKINKRKNLFFKKKNSQKSLISKRLSIVLKKRKKIKLHKVKKVDKGNFFFKKFFFKTLLKSRKFLKKFFFLNTKVRQKKISKLIFKNQKRMASKKNYSYEYSVLNTLLRSNIFFFIKDLMLFVKAGHVYINNKPILNYALLVNDGDCIQIPISREMYNYINFSKKVLKKKIALFKHTS